MLNTAQISQISNTHKLIDFIFENENSLYSEQLFLKKSKRINPEFWVDLFIPRALEGADLITERMIHNLSRKNDLFGNTPASKITSFLFNNKWFRKSSLYNNKNKAMSAVKLFINEKNPVEIIIPIFSRKPNSPLKNRGNLPDLTEIFTLIRLKQIADVINYFSPSGCKITILADGRKYNRACLTDNDVIQQYQTSLNFWIKKIGALTVLDLCDYEKYVTTKAGEDNVLLRNALYQENLINFSTLYDKYFFSGEVKQSLDTIKTIDNIGQQLSSTFLSIITSLDYTRIQELSIFYFINSNKDLFSSIYYSFIKSIFLSIDDAKNLVDTLGNISGAHLKECFLKMRQETWEATKRYVAISLADRKLNVLKNRNKNILKFTVHPKMDEFSVITTSGKYYNMLAQHCTGGIYFSNGKIKPSFKYCCVREKEGEVPLILTALEDTEENREKFGPMVTMSKKNQPFAYCAEDMFLKKNDWPVLLDMNF